MLAPRSTSDLEVIQSWCGRIGLAVPWWSRIMTMEIKCVINEHVEAPTCLCGDAGMAGVMGPIYVGLDGEKIFVLIIVES